MNQVVTHISYRKDSSSPRLGIRMSSHMSCLLHFISFTAKLTSSLQSTHDETWRETFESDANNRRDRVFCFLFMSRMIHSEYKLKRKSKTTSRSMFSANHKNFCSHVCFDQFSASCTTLTFFLLPFTLYLFYHHISFALLGHVHHGIVRSNWKEILALKRVLRSFSSSRYYCFVVLQ